MSHKFDNITIVGGGSSGWMTAATFIKFFPNKNITVIESPDYPVVGVGESTLGQINVWKNLLGIEDEDFMKATDASYKLSIKFTDFYKKDSGGFHYPFGRCYYDNDSSLSPPNDWAIKKNFYPETPISDFTRTYFPAMPLIESNKIHKNENGIFDNFNFDKDSAYHFDAIKFGQWLKNNYCLPKGVNLICDTVKKINTNDDGIDYLILESNGIVKSDLYIDCTGWKSLLLGGALKEEFISYNDILPNNRAWATQLPYSDKEKELECYTNSTALTNGWVWNIPLWSRIGTGYVYSDTFTTKEDALIEFKQHLQSNKMTHFNPNRNVDDLNYKDIEMRIGIHEKTWVKNVVAIGLSAGFIEPLESNGLFTVHEFLLKLVKSLQRDVYTQWDIDCYNASVKEMFDTFAQFVSLHYALSNRDDSEYWREVNNRSFATNMLDGIVKPLDEYVNLKYRKMIMCGHPSDSNAGIHCIATGMNYNMLDKLDIEIMQMNTGFNYKNLIDTFIDKWNKNYENRLEESKKSPSLLEYLKNNIHT
jgi:hypothetical protein